MPANRMNTEVGSTLKVIGRRSAMVSAGPRPGSTPIAVPSVVPTRHHSRFFHVSAMTKPFIRFENASMSRPREQSDDAIDHPADERVERILDQARADVDAERLGKSEIGDQREGGADRGVAHDRGRAETA